MHDSTNDTYTRQQVIAAFKGFLLNHRLEPSNYTAPPDRHEDVWHGLVHRDDEYFDFHFRRRDHERLLDLVERLYPGQTHRGTVSGVLTDVTREWLETGGSQQGQGGLEQAASQFLARVEEQVRSLVVFVPIEGINATFTENVQVARCELCRNSADSELQRAAAQSRQRAHVDDEAALAVEQAPAYFKVKVQSHFKRALVRAGEESDLAMNVLRLFLSSFYFDLYNRSVPTRMGILGTLHEGRYGSMYVVRESIAVDEQRPGFQENYQHLFSYDITNETIAYLKAHGLSLINGHLSSVEQGGGGDTPTSLLRAINWFGKAARAETIAESYLMYAISIEALLSGGDRTPKETYAQRIAVLVTRGENETLFPVEGHLDRQFAKDLKAAADRATRFALVRSRAVDLFGTRNAIAHGATLDSQIDALDLLDFETLIRNAILSFVDGGWNSLSDFKRWMAEDIH